jgi:ABC-type dipeptide/oligopeptide/nickel transport system ATPase component
VRSHILEQMEAFGIAGGPEVARKYPHQLSGGMRQRIAIAMALESEAKLLIADEPTTSLDTINQRRAVEFIDNLRRERGLSMLYITHNLGIIQAVCENVIIMKDGGIVEQGRTQDVFSHPKHEYSQRLLDETRRIQR